MERLQDLARAATSKPVQRNIVNAALVLCSAVSLLFLAGIATALFFQGFVPDQVVTRPIHLQYGWSVNPYGIVPLNAPKMKAQQDYDVSVQLSLPRSPPNVERGNFMVSLFLLDTKPGPVLEEDARSFADNHKDFGGSGILFYTRRSALMPYVDPIVSLASRTLFLLYHLLFPSSQTCTMLVPLEERVSFPESSVPAAAYVEVEAGQTVQIYEAKLIMTAQLRGLRWLMFHYRLPTFFVFTFFFWVFELLFMGASWAVLGELLWPAQQRPKPEADEHSIKLEDKGRTSLEKIPSA